MKAQDGHPDGGAARRPADDKRMRARELALRLRAEDALRESEKRFRDLVDLLPQVVYECDATGHLTFANRVAFQWFGYTPEDMAGGKTTLEMVVPADRERAAANMRRVMAGERPADHGYTAQRKDGSTFPVAIYSTPILRDGQPVGLRGIIIDLTEREALEAQLRQAQKMEVIGRLAGGIAHDFNNLLTPILGYTDMALAQLPDDAPLRADLHLIQEAAERSATLVRQILAFSRRQMLDVRRLNLNDVIANVSSMLTRLIGEDVQLTMQLAPTLSEVRADAAQIEQVLMNLAVNARDAMSSGGKLIIQTADVILDAADLTQQLDLRPGPYVLLTVTDTGCGMSEEVRTHLFEPFFTTKETGKGTGLGLSTVYGIVRQHSGAIDVSSCPGHGTTFRIYLPHAPTPVPDSTPEAGGPFPPPNLTEGAATILLVEDEPIVRRMACAALTARGYRVIEAGNGNEALAAATRHDGPIHLLVTDVVMPGMDGRELYRRLEAINPGLRLLCTSGYPDGIPIAQGGAMPHAHFLPKPFSATGLVAKVREALGAPSPAPR